MDDRTSGIAGLVATGLAASVFVSVDRGTPTVPVVERCDVPERVLLRKYRDGIGYADCYFSDVPDSISQRAFVEAFYTTALFKLERAVLRWFAGRPSTDVEARELAAGDRQSFAAWRVEDRTADELLVADFTGRTRSWLMASPISAANGMRTRLYFGSAVVPRPDVAPGKRTMGFAFHALLGFHAAYSRALLRAARSRLLAKPGPGAQ